jgi:multimeric flavodoxin WrbA
MKILLITGTPKQEGLSCSCVEAAEKGVHTAGAELEIIRLCDLNLEPCHICGDGWGSCIGSKLCTYGDDGFSELQIKVGACDALIIQTPVYWGEMTEKLKSFTDRLRRCEALSGKSVLDGKKVLLIAAPGGSGNGGITCLAQMERFVQHMHGQVFDYVLVNRWNREYKLSAIEAASNALARG